MLNFCDIIQVFVFTTNHHLNYLCTKFLMKTVYITKTLPDRLDCSLVLEKV